MADGWQQPAARIDPDVLTVIEAADHHAVQGAEVVPDHVPRRGHTFEDLLSRADRETLLAFGKRII